MKLFPIVVAVGLLVTAGAHASSPPSGLQGTVSRGPISPVCAAEQPCTELARGVTLVFSLAGRIAGRTTTDDAGKYRIRLAPGRYQISRTTQPRIGRGLEPGHARVFPGHFARVDLSIDTGIR